MTSRLAFPLDKSSHKNNNRKNDNKNVGSSHLLRFFLFICFTRC